MWVEIFFSIISILSLAFCSIIIIDKSLFTQKLRNIEFGMTGKEVQEAANIRLEIVKIDGNIYYARIKSYLSLFKYRLVFCNGKLFSKQRY